MQVLPWMNFIAAIDARVVKRIQDQLPRLRQLIERRLNQPSGPLQPWVQVWPGERAGKERWSRNLGHQYK
jgi:hypothetical protein